MNFKVVYSDEIKRLPAIPESFASLREVIKTAFKDSLVTDFVVQYQDKGVPDFKVLHSEADFKAFVEKNMMIKQDSIKVVVQPTTYPVFIKEEEPHPTPVKEETVKKVEAEVKENIEKPNKKEKREKSREKSRKKHKEFNPVVSEAEAAVRAELLKKREEKQQKKAQVEKLRTEVHDLKEMLTLLEVRKLEHKGKLISLKKTKANDESITKEEAAKLRETKIALRDELKPIKQEIHDIKLKVHNIKNEVRELKGKEPKAQREKSPKKGKGRERKCGKRIELNENLQEELASPTPVVPEKKEKKIKTPEQKERNKRVKGLVAMFPHVTKKFIKEMIHDNPTITDEQIAATLIQA